jgi:hypothetical protein
MLHPATELAQGQWPSGDGWGWLYRIFDRLAPPTGWLRRVVCRYFWPNDWERAGGGGLYRLLGVHWFGRVIPTGGITIRRLTGQKMAAYTLRGPSVGAARDFYYRTCVFEALHLPFLAAMAALTLRQLVLGRLDLALQDTVVNLLFNIYPILHHRRTRGRIVDLLAAAAPARARRQRFGDG